MVLYGGEKTLFMILFSLLFIFPFFSPSFFLILLVMWLQKEDNKKRYKNKDNIPFRHISFLSVFPSIFFLSFLFSRPCVYHFVDINHLRTCQQWQSILSQCIKSITICSFKYFLKFCLSNRFIHKTLLTFHFFFEGSFSNDVQHLREGGWSGSVRHSIEENNFIWKWRHLRTNLIENNADIAPSFELTWMRHDISWWQ